MRWPMDVWWERVILVGGLLLLAPTALLLPVYGPFALAFSPIGIIMLVVWYRVRERRLSSEPIDTTPRPGRPPAVPVASESDIAALPEPVTACPDCGYVGVRMPTLADGVWPGGGELGSRVVCPRCHYQGLAVSFDKREEYGAWLADLNKDRGLERDETPSSG